MTDRKAIEQVIERLEHVYDQMSLSRKLFLWQRGDTYKCILDLRDIAAQEQAELPSVEAASCGIHWERERAVEVLRGIGPDEAALNEWAQRTKADPDEYPDQSADEVFAYGFNHCRTKAIAAIRGGAESYEPKPFDPDETQDMPKEVER